MEEDDKIEDEDEEEVESDEDEDGDGDEDKFSNGGEEEELDALQRSQAEEEAVTIEELTAGLTEVLDLTPEDLKTGRRTATKVRDLSDNHQVIY